MLWKFRLYIYIYMRKILLISYRQFLVVLVYIYIQVSQIKLYNVSTILNSLHKPTHPSEATEVYSYEARLLGGVMSTISSCSYWASLRIFMDAHRTIKSTMIKQRKPSMTEYSTMMFTSGRHALYTRRVTMASLEQGLMEAKEPRLDTGTG